MDEFGSGQHGAHLRADLIEKFGEYAVRSAIRRGTLRCPWPRVAVEARRWPALRTRGAAALLSFGPFSVLTAWTAAEMFGCDAGATPRTHLLLPYERYVRPRSGLVVHHTGAYCDDIETVDGLRVLALDRVVAQLLCRARPRDALAVCDQALALQPPEVRERFRALIHRRIDERRDPRGTRRGRELLALATGRAESPAESWLLLQVVEFGFPHPEVNWVLVSPWGTEVHRLDLAWPDLRIALEHDGYAVHAERGAADEARRADLERRGWILVVATAADLRDFSALATRLRDAFRRRGYTW